MRRDRLARCCGHCGTPDTVKPYTLRVRVEYPDTPGFPHIPGWYAYACSKDCHAKIKTAIAADYAGMVASTNKEHTND